MNLACTNDRCGKYNPENPLPEGSSRAKIYNGMLAHLKGLTDKLASIGQSQDAATPDVATAWAITKPHYIDGLVRASSITLTSDDIAELEALADDAKMNTRGFWEQEM